MANDAEVIAAGLLAIAAAIEKRTALERERFDKQYPSKREVVDATITHRQTEEERLREAQGDTDETDAEWIGPREQAFAEATTGKA